MYKRLKRLELSTFCMASRRSSQLSYSRIGLPSIARDRAWSLISRRLPIGRKSYAGNA